MKNIIIVVLLGLLIVVSILLNVTILYLKYENNIENKEQIHYQELEDAASNLRNNSFRNYMMESCKVIIPAIYNADGEVFTHAFISRRRILFIPVDVCLSCRDAVLLSVKDQNQIKHRSDVIVLFENSNARELQLLKSKFRFPKDFLFSMKGRINLATGGYPCFFTLDENSRIRHFFLAEPYNLFLVKDYLTFSENINDK